MNRIIFVNRYFYPDHSATSQLLSELAFELVRQGSNVEIISSSQLYDDAKANLLRRDEINGVKVWRVSSTSFGRGNLGGRVVDYLTFYLSATILMLRTVRAGDLLVAKTDPPLISVVAAFVAKLRGAILVNWVQDVFPEVASALGVKGFTPAVNHLLVRLRNKSWYIAKANVVLGQKMADYLVDAGVGKNSIHIINNWVDDDKLEPINKEDNRLRHEWGLSDKFIVGYSGNMGRAHEFSTILQIASAFQDDPQVVFLFIGGGAQRGTIEADANKYGLNNILFQPYQDTELLPISLSVPDLHLISLKPELEGFIVPSKFYGIAAVARPVLYIGDDKGEIPMILKDNGGGITISIGDASGGVMYIKKLIRDNEYRIRLGMQMKDMAEKQFSKSKALKAWHDVFTDIVN